MFLNQNVSLDLITIQSKKNKNKKASIILKIKETLKELFKDKNTDKRKKIIKLKNNLFIEKNIINLSGRFKKAEQLIFFYQDYKVWFLDFLNILDSDKKIYFYLRCFVSSNWYKADFPKELCCSHKLELLDKKTIPYLWSSILLYFFDYLLVNYSNKYDKIVINLFIWSYAMKTKFYHNTLYFFKKNNFIKDYQIKDNKCIIVLK